MCQMANTFCYQHEDNPNTALQTRSGFIDLTNSVIVTDCQQDRRYSSYSFTDVLSVGCNISDINSSEINDKLILSPKDLVYF